MVNKVESRYIMEPSTDKNSGNVLEWWSAESELSIWPSARQLERKFLNVACRAIVLNETLYQRVASTNVTSAAALTVQQVQRSRASSSSTITSSTSGGPSSGQQHQVSASMASSQHSRDSYSFSAASKGTHSCCPSRYLIGSIHRSASILTILEGKKHQTNRDRENRKSITSSFLFPFWLYWLNSSCWLMTPLQT